MESSRFISNNSTFFELENRRQILHCLQRIPRNVSKLARVFSFQILFFRLNNGRRLVWRRSKASEYSFSILLHKFYEFSNNFRRSQPNPRRRMTRKRRMTGMIPTFRKSHLVEVCRNRFSWLARGLINWISAPSRGGFSGRGRGGSFASGDRTERSKFIIKPDLAIFRLTSHTSRNWWRQLHRKDRNRSGKGRQDCWLRRLCHQRNPRRIRRENEHS